MTWLKITFLASKSTCKAKHSQDFILIHNCGCCLHWGGVCLHTRACCMILHFFTVANSQPPDPVKKVQYGPLNLLVTKKGKLSLRAYLLTHILSSPLYWRSNGFYDEKVASQRLPTGLTLTHPSRPLSPAWSWYHKQWFSTMIQRRRHTQLPVETTKKVSPLSRPLLVEHICSSEWFQSWKRVSLTLYRVTMVVLHYLLLTSN